MSPLCVASRVSEGVSFTIAAETVGSATALNYRLSSDRAVHDWFLEVTGPRRVIGVFGGRCDPVGPDRFRIVPDVFTRSLNATAPVELSVLVA
ncbi:MAG: hypothetical protein AAF318_19075 [Pseudomonadota bacterium]